MRRSTGARRLGLPSLAAAAFSVGVGWGAPSAAESSKPPIAPAAAAPTTAAPAPAPALVPSPASPAGPAPESASAAAGPTPGEGGAGPPPAERVAPVPTADESPAPSDHDAVIHHVGVSAGRFDPGPVPLVLRPGFGCPAAAITVPCEVSMGALSMRYWSTRNLAWNAGLAFAVGGGRDGAQSLDTYLGVGPVLGLTLLLGNWRHLAVGASPELAVVWFRPGPSGATGSTTMIDFRAALEAELHFGFIGVPALSVGIVTGLGFQFESGSDARVWSVGVIGAESAWGVLSNLFVRYYL